ncbi:MAG: cation diffusion facilitator family transporter, partial [Nostoc sp.]|uniref:cation diffusion facilitator family transporter n=1 Tax=Nostoc sp. TaxID=1180 RepID=UPI002FEF1770
MVHNHKHQGHEHGQGNYNRAFAIGTALNIGFVIVEAVYGYRADSLALVADAGHNLSDVLGLLLAWGASALSRRPPTRRHTYGLRRSSILAALVNALVLLLAMGAIAWEAVRRFSEPSSYQVAVRCSRVEKEMAKTEAKVYGCIWLKLR